MQAREPNSQYEHTAIGYNYRMSNLLAAIGRGDFLHLEDNRCRRDIDAYYKDHLEGMPGIEFMPEAAYERSSRWLTCIAIDPRIFGSTREM